MTVQVDTAHLVSAEHQLLDLAGDVNVATHYVADHLESFSGWGDGRAIGLVLQAHASYVTATFDALSASKKLLEATGYALGTSAARYDKTEDDAAVSLGDLFRDLDPSAPTPPLTADSPPTGDAATVPSAALKEPEATLDDEAFKVIWQIVKWPDLLSVSWWARKALNEVFHLVWPGFGGDDLFEFLAEQLGGDWENIALAGDAFGNTGDYFVALSRRVHDDGVAMFAGWSAGQGASQVGEFLAEMGAAFAKQQDVFSELDTKYTDAAWAAYNACDLMLSALDAAVDAVVAELMGGVTFVTAIASLADLGATAPVALIEAVVAAVEALESAWGIMMAAVSGVIAGGALLGAATREITFVPIPAA